MPTPGSVMIRTPKKPISSAVQRATPTASRSSSAETSVENSGAEKLIAMALASGSRVSATMMQICALPWMAARVP